ncbi:hypothetical protein BDQ17DRAFT_1435086 [Cyathus striatus]|nr:hypothetical protein BDQ17DRAFT_1435086 [Cyathus striatus]
MIAPLEVLKSGLLEAKQRIKKKHDALLECLSHKEQLTAAEETWLDYGDGNLIDKTAVVDILENASDYECGLSQLNSQKKALVDKLKELGNGIRNTVIPGKKRKRPENTKCTPAEYQSAKSKNTTVPIFTKKENATLAQQIKILDWHHQSAHKNQGETVAHWDKIYPNLKLKQPAISKWLAKEDKWCTVIAVSSYPMSALLLCTLCTLCTSDLYRSHPFTFPFRSPD